MTAPANDAAIAMPARAVKPSGGSAAEISEEMRVTTTSFSISATGRTRLPRPSKAANHSATIAGKAGCVLIGALAARLALEDGAIVATRGPSSTPCSRTLGGDAGAAFGRAF